MGIGTFKPTTIALQMADRSLTYPKGIVEDVLVRVHDFIFPADFVVLDMEEDKDVPLIFGWPFLATRRALIDVEKGELTLRINDEHVTISMYKVVEPSEEDTKLQGDRGVLRERGLSKKFKKKCANSVEIETIEKKSAPAFELKPT
ncbi:hypothetical protein OROGR_008202 [Orobanche gracilis]